MGARGKTGNLKSGKRKGGLTMKGMEGMEKFFMCYMLFMVSFGRRKFWPQKGAKRKAGKRESGNGVLTTKYTNHTKRGVKTRMADGKSLVPWFLGGSKIRVHLC
jgi:hypothetical protein